MKQAILSFAGPAVLLLAAPCSLPLSAAPADHKPAVAKKTSDPFLSGEPFTLDQVVRLLKEDAIPLRRRKEAIEHRGVDFPLSSDALARLHATGAPEELLEATKSKAKTAAAAAAPAAKAAPKGNLTISCAPAECQISLNGTGIGQTANGTLQASGLTPGTWVVDFAKDGYVGRQATVSVDATRAATVTATLSPAPVTVQAFGAHLFKKVIESVGGEDGIKTLSSVQATGSTTIWGRNGDSVRWTLLMRNQPDRALFQAKSGRIVHEVAFTGSEFKASRNLKGDEALELPTDFGLIRDYQLAALLARLENGSYKMAANHPDPVANEEFSLVAEGGTDKISIGLDSDGRPARMKIATDAGLGSALITYADYVQNGNAYYPKTMLIKPDGKAQGIEVRFDTVELNPNLKDADFRLRSRPLLSWGN